MAALAGVASLAVALGCVGLLWQKQQARAAELQARQKAYVLFVNAAELALKANESSRAASFLEQLLPVSKAETDLRGFEWRHLYQRCQADADAMLGRLPSAVRCLEVSPNGRWLAGGAEGGGLKIWDLLTGEELTLQLPLSGVRTFATFSPDSRLVLFGYGTYEEPPPLGKIAVWDLAARKRLAPITDLRGIGPLAFSADGHYFAYGVALRWRDRASAGRGVVVLNSSTRNVVAELVAETDQTDSVRGFDAVLTPDSQHIIFGEIGPQPKLGYWRIGPESKPQYFPMEGEPETALAISPDGRLLATGSGFTETVIRLWEVPSFRFLGLLTGHNRWVYNLKFSPDGRTLASASADQTIRLWDVKTRTTKSPPHQLRNEVWRVCFSPDGRSLFGGDKDGHIYRWPADTNALKPDFSLRTTDFARGSIVMAPDAKDLAGLRRGEVFLTEAQTATPLRPLTALGTNNSCLLFSPDRQHLFAGTQTGEIQVWSLARQQLQSRWRGSGAPVRRLHLDARGRMLTSLQWENPLPKDSAVSAEAAGMAEGRKQWFYGLTVEQPARVGVWNVTEGQEWRSRTIPGPLSASAVSRNGRFLATGHYEGSIYLWNLSSGQVRSNSIARPGYATSLTFSPDGRFLAAAVFAAGVVRVWDVPSLQRRVDVPHREEISVAGFSPDAKRLVTAGGGANALRLWDVATWQQLITFEHPRMRFLDLAFSEDGNSLSAINYQSEVLVWRAPSLAEIEAKEKKARP